MAAPWQQVNPKVDRRAPSFTFSGGAGWLGHSRVTAQRPRFNLDHLVTGCPYLNTSNGTDESKFYHIIVQWHSSEKDIEGQRSLLK